MRALIVIVLATGVWLAWRVHEARKQRAAVQAIQARGGNVEYDYKYDAARDRLLPNGKPRWPVWLQRAIGDENFFHDVVWVGLDFDQSERFLKPTDADLVCLEDLNHLIYLHAGGGHITDAGLEHLKNLTELRMLFLWRDPISGTGLAHLRGLRKLRHLDLSNTRVTDDRLAYLKDLTGLERIDLPNNPQLTGAFLQHVASLPGLKSLLLRGSGITDSGLDHLKGAKNLEFLMLDGTKVTDAGLTHLRGLTCLRELDLSRTKVTDAGLTHLRGLSNLRSLDVSKTAVSAGGVGKLAAWLPLASVKSSVVIPNDARQDDPIPTKETHH